MPPDSSNEYYKASKSAQQALTDASKQTVRVKKKQSFQVNPILLIVLLSLLGFYGFQTYSVVGIATHEEQESNSVGYEMPQIILRSSNQNVGLEALDPCAGTFKCLLVFTSPNCKECEGADKLIRGLQEFSEDFSSNFGIKVVVGGGYKEQLDRMAGKIPGQVFMDYNNQYVSAASIRKLPAWIIWNQKREVQYQQYGVPTLKGAPFTQAEIFLDYYVSKLRPFPEKLQAGRWSKIKVKKVKASKVSKSKAGAKAKDLGKALKAAKELKKPKKGYTNFLSKSVAKGEESKAAFDRRNSELIATANDILEEGEEEEEAE